MESAFKNVYEKLESRILGESSDLTINEYKTLLGVNIIAKGRINNGIIIALIKGFDNKSLDVNKLLDILMENISTEEQLLVLALLLRNGANVNKMIPLDDKEVHILAYTHIKYQQNIAMRNTILLLLLFSGADVNAEIVKDSNMSVLNWSQQQGIDTILSLDKSMLLDNCDDKLSAKIGTLLNKPELIKNFGIINLIEVIRDHSHQVFSRMIPNLSELNKNGKIIDLCIKYYNECSLRSCLNNGVVLRYYQITLLTLQSKFGESKIIKETIENMLNDYINHGGYLDQYQSIIIGKNIKLVKNVTEQYILDNLLNSGYDIKKPYVLSVKKSYVEHGASYGIDPRLQHPKKGSDFLDLSEPLGPKGLPNPLGTLDPPSKLVATPNTFEQIIDNKKIHGTVNGTESIQPSSEYLSALFIQRSLTKRLGYTVNKSKSKLTESYLNDEKFHRMEKAFGTLVKLNTNKTINNISMIEMETIIKDIEGGSIPLLNMLTADHYRRTFAITCYERSASLDILEHFNVIV